MQSLIAHTMKPEPMPWGDVGAHFEDLDGYGFSLNGPPPELTHSLSIPFRRSAAINVDDRRSVS